MTALRKFKRQHLLLVLCVACLFTIMSRRAVAQAQPISGIVCYEVTYQTTCDIEAFAQMVPNGSASQVETTVGTYINDLTLLDSDDFAHVEGFLTDRAGQLNDAAAGSDNAGRAVAYMHDPIPYNHGQATDDVYQVEVDSYLEDFDYPPDVEFAAAVTILFSFGAPTITSLNPTYGFVGRPGTVTIQGSDFVDPFTNSVNVSLKSGTGVTVTSVTPSGDPFGVETLTVGYTIDHCASLGERFFLVTNEFGSDTGDRTFNVGDPPPMVLNVTPNPWQAGSTIPITVGGNGFGDSPSLAVAGNGVSLVSTGTTSDTSIPATVAVATTTPRESATVTVRSNGYCGTGFQPAYPGELSSAVYVVSVTPVPAPAPAIYLYQGSGGTGGTDITNQITNMLSGQQIALTAVVQLPNGLDFSTSQPPHWTGGADSTQTILPDGVVVGGFTNPTGSLNSPPDNTGGCTLLIEGQTGTTGSCNVPPVKMTNTSSFTFYWVDSGNGRQLTYTYTMNNGESASATTTFNVDGPSGVSIAPPPGKQIQGDVNIVPPPTGVGGSYPVLQAGNINVGGIDLVASSTHLPGGQYQWVQLLKSDFEKIMCGTGPISKATVSSSSPPVLDNHYPYTVVSGALNEEVTDSPGAILKSLAGEKARSFSANMFLMWVPPASSAPACPNGSACSMPVPLGSFPWSWAGDAINSQQVSSNLGVVFPNWLMNAKQKDNKGFGQSSSFPTWTATSVSIVFQCN